MSMICLYSQDISSNPDEDFVLSVDDFHALGAITKLLAAKTCQAVSVAAGVNTDTSLPQAYRVAG